MNPFDMVDRQQTLFFETADYKIKIYNKSQEAKLNHNLLRLEIERINTAHYLPKMKTVAEVINKNNFKVLANELLKKFNQIQFTKEIPATLKCNDDFLAFYFNQKGVALARKSIKEKYGNKKAKYFTEKYNIIAKSISNNNIFQQEILQEINNQLVQILDSIPNL